MRTSLSALLLAATFVVVSSGARAADVSIENATSQAAVFAAKTFSAPTTTQPERSAPVFADGQNRGIVVNPAAPANSGY